MTDKATRTIASVLIALAVWTGAVTTGHAVTLQQQQRMQNDLMQKRLNLGLPYIERRQRQLDFQAQQRLYRQQDRIRMQQDRLKPVVPRMRPTCQNQIHGNEYLRRNCP